MFLPLIAVCISLQFLPDQIPAHYAISGEVNRWGSKYETLIFPGISIILGLFILFITKKASKQEVTGHNNQKIGIITGILLLILLNIMTFYFLYLDFYQIENLTSVSIDLTQLVWTSLGVILIILGNIMPKLKLNSMIGLRTKWSMKNEVTWKKSQQFGGISSIIAGLLIIVSNLLIQSPGNTLISLFILVASLPLDIYYSYKTAKKY